MPASRIQLQSVLQRRYDCILFSKDVLRPIFNSAFSLNSSLVKPSFELSNIESLVIDKVGIYGKIGLEDSTEITCYEILLKPNVQLEYSKVAIQHYVRKLLTVGQAALINFISPTNNKFWRLTLVAKDSILTEKGIKEKATYAKRYTFLLGPSETCKTAAERFELLSTEAHTDLEKFVNAFSVEKLSKSFFNEYKEHYNRFVKHLMKPAISNSVFDGDEKAVRDFSKKLLGRIVFLYFVQKKGWLGASDTNYKDGLTDFIKQLFHLSGGNDAFYPNWLTKLFFDTINNSQRKEDNFEMPNGKTVKIPFLNGGLFDKEEYDDKIITFPSKIFHNHDNEDDPKYRGFLDFLDAYNFTVYEDSPEEQTVAVDPEMLGHIFENLLEDNKDKGAFYTPKEIVHYMCQESLIEYLTTHLSKEYTVYQILGKDQIEFFGNETRVGQLSLLEKIGDKALNRDDVSSIVKTKDISQLTKEQLTRIDQLLDSVKICDPAIGSGAFPMGLLQEIYSIKEAISYENSIEWKPSEVKENIIQKSIYGVDIEKGAVDIARLRFWLSLVVDEEKPKPLPNLDYKIVAGDSLLSRFDSEVIEIEWNRSIVSAAGEEYLNNIKKLLLEVANTQKKYFHSDNKIKPKMSIEIRNLKIELLINQFSLNKIIYANNNQEVIDSGIGLTAKEKIKNSKVQLTLANYDKVIKSLESLKKQTNLHFNHFDWKLDFPEILNPYIVGEKGGFDIVIGNPPYIQLQKMGYECDLLEKVGFQTFTRTGDIYCLFYELGINLLKGNGILTFITSNTWMRTKYGGLLRNYFINNSNPLKLINFEDTQIFQAATVETNVIIIQKTTWNRNLKATALRSDYLIGTPLSPYFENNHVILNELNKDSWTILGKVDFEIKSQIEKQGKKLNTWDIEFYRGFLTGFNDAFFINELKRRELITEDPKSAEIIKPLLRGREIKKFGFHFNNNYVIFSHNGLKGNKNKKISALPRIDVEKNYKAIYKHLLLYKDKKSPLAKRNSDGTWQSLIDRADKGTHWTNLRDCAYINLFEKPKLIWLAITDKPAFAYDVENYITAPAYFLSGKNLKYLLGLLNSKVVEWYLDKVTSSTGQGANQWSKIFVEQIPIPELDEKGRRPFELLSDYLIFLYSDDKPQVNPYAENKQIASFFEEVLNICVYELYFTEHMKENEIDVLKYLNFPAIDLIADNEEKAKVINDVYKKLQAQDHPIRNRIILANIKSPDIIRRINSTTH